MSHQRSTAARLNEGFRMLAEGEDGPHPNDVPHQHSTHRGQYEGHTVEDDDMREAVKSRENQYPW
jgi:hypothetical protein